MSEIYLPQGVLTDLTVHFTGEFSRCLDYARCLWLTCSRGVFCYSRRMFPVPP